MIQDEQELAPMPAATYRELWLEAAFELGQVECILADALGIPPTARSSRPAADLADEAAARIVMLQRLIGTTKHRGPRQPARRGRVRA